MFKKLLQFSLFGLITAVAHATAGTDLQMVAFKDYVVACHAAGLTTEQSATRFFQQVDAATLSAEEVPAEQAEQSGNKKIHRNKKGLTQTQKLAIALGAAVLVAGLSYGTYAYCTAEKTEIIPEVLQGYGIVEINSPGIQAQQRLDEPTTTYIAVGTCHPLDAQNRPIDRNTFDLANMPITQFVAIPTDSNYAWQQAPNIIGVVTTALAAVPNVPHIGRLALETVPKIMQAGGLMAFIVNPENQAELMQKIDQAFGINSMELLAGLIQKMQPQE